MKRRLLASLIGIVLVAAVALGITVGTGNQPSLGLDLQGGASVTLQPEGDYDAVALDVAVEIIRSRVDSIGVAEPEIIRQGDTVVVNLPGVKDQQRALDIVGRTGDLQLRPVLQSGAFDTSEPSEVPASTETTIPSDTTLPDEGGPGESRGARPMVDTTVPTSDTTVPTTDTTVAVTDTSVAATDDAPTDAEPIDATAEDGSTVDSQLPEGSEVLLGRD
ncbi:MAG: hypothetical protein ACO3V6_06905, partial [Ilumatobacteraceae bacterium]